MGTRQNISMALLITPRYKDSITAWPDQATQAEWHHLQFYQSKACQRVRHQAMFFLPHVSFWWVLQNYKFGVIIL